MVFDGGDIGVESTGMEILLSDGEYYGRTFGTSLATPLIASMAAEIISAYPELNMESVKALLINNAIYNEASYLPHFKDNEVLLKKLIGFGKPDIASMLENSDDSITLIVEDYLRNKEFIAIPIFLPEYLTEAKNKLIFTVSLVYKVNPNYGNHLNYNSVHMSFNLMKNISVEELAYEASGKTYIKSDFSWSEDHFGIENLLLSNVQKKVYRLQPRDILNLNGELALALRCIAKPTSAMVDDEKQYPFSIVINIKEEVKNRTLFNLYTEMINQNELLAIADLEQDLEAVID